MVSGSGDLLAPVPWFLSPGPWFLSPVSPLLTLYLDQFLIFVLVDGWTLVVRMLLESFGGPP